MMMEVKTASAKTTMKLQKGCEAMLWKDCEANTVSSSTSAMTTVTLWKVIEANTGSNLIANVHLYYPFFVSLRKKSILD